VQVARHLPTVFRLNGRAGPASNPLPPASPAPTSPPLPPPPTEPPLQLAPAPGPSPRGPAPSPLPEPARALTNMSTTRPKDDA
jgi:hypothetical protein